MRLKIEWNATPRHHSIPGKDGLMEHVMLANFGVSLDGKPCTPEGVYAASRGKPLSEAEHAVYDAVLATFCEALADKIIEQANKALAEKPPALLIQDKDGNDVLRVG